MIDTENYWHEAQASVWVASKFLADRRALNAVKTHLLAPRAGIRATSKLAESVTSFGSPVGAAVSSRIMCGGWKPKLPGTFACQDVECSAVHTVVITVWRC